MTITLPVPPRLPRHIWRALRREDAPALHRLELDCASTDVTTNLSTIAAYEKKFEEAGGSAATDTLCAASPAGQLAAAAWVSCDKRLKHEFRAFLDGEVHPDYRGGGLGSFVLEWMEARARQIFAAQSEDRTCVLRIDFYDRGDDAIALFKKYDFRFAHAEEEMRRDLSQPIHATSLPSGMTFVTWTPQRAGQFFRAYEDAFRERPRFPGWSQEVWCHNLTEDAGFRADLSLLVLEGREPVGFAICHVEIEGDEKSGSEGWIAQFGVRPVWRNQGLGSALLAEVMQTLKAKGLSYAMLCVNVNNPEAFRLYGRLGFERYRRRTSFQKRVSRTGGR